MLEILVILGFIIWSCIAFAAGYFVGQQENKPPKAGILWVNDTDIKTQYQLIFTAPLDDIPKMKECYFQIELAEKTGYLMKDD